MFPALSQYLVWANIPKDANDTLWLSDTFNNMLKKHYSDLVNRRNVFTNKLYKDDDTCAAFCTFERLL